MLESNQSWSSTLDNWATPTSSLTYTTAFLPSDTTNVSSIPSNDIASNWSLNAHSNRLSYNGYITTSLTLYEWIPHLEKLHGQVHKFGTPTIIGIGCAGNILSVLVFFHTNLRKQSSSYYLAALGISDTGFLLLTFINWFSLYDISQIYHQSVYCELFTYLSSVFSCMSVWFVVGFTVERFIAVQYPLKRPTLCSVSRAKFVLVVITLIASIINVPLFWFAVSIENGPMNKTVCGMNDLFRVCFFEIQNYRLNNNYHLP